MPEKKTILERLDEGVVLGDGGFVFALEKRGYVKAGPWTPEATVEHPDAVRELHREFLRAGSDVMQTFTFYASDDKLENRGNVAKGKFSGAKINQAACDLAREVADEGDALVAGGLSQTPTYLSGRGKEAVQDEFKKQLQIFIKNKVDFMIVEYYEHVEECVWAIEVCKEAGFVVAASLCINEEGDLHGVPTGECGVRMAQAGAEIIGINCHFDPRRTLVAVADMKRAVEAAGLTRHYIAQPLGYHTPDAEKQGFIDLPEFPFALEPRILTRFDMHRYAREAYDMGIRYIGGCCGFEPYHIRACAEELAGERGKLPAASAKHGMWGSELRMHTKPWVRARARREYWETLNPSCGRPYSATLSRPSNWKVTAGDAQLIQHAEPTSDAELQASFERPPSK